MSLYKAYSPQFIRLAFSVPLWVHHLLMTVPIDYVNSFYNGNQDSAGDLNEAFLRSIGFSFENSELLGQSYSHFNIGIKKNHSVPFYNGERLPDSIINGPYKKVNSIIKEVSVSDDRLTFDGFVKTHDVVKEEMFTELEHALLYACEHRLLMMDKSYLEHYCHKIEWSPYLGPKDTEYYVDIFSQEMFVLKNNSVVGGVTEKTRMVLPEYRRQGIGVDIILFCHDNPVFNILKPAYYSSQGYASRKKAFECLKNRAGRGKIIT